MITWRNQKNDGSACAMSQDSILDFGYGIK